jgi:hypothetical protein
MRETHGKKNNPHIYDIFDQWSICHAMYNKRLKVYKQGGFNIPKSNKVKEEENFFKKGQCFINI